MMQVIHKLINNSHNTTMRTLFLLILLIAAWIVAAGREASCCNVCHSKDPKMVKMHQELGFKDCFKCHGQGLEKTPERQKARMIGDEHCIPCHKK